MLFGSHVPLMPSRRIDLFAVPLAGLIAAVLCGCGGSGGSRNAADAHLPLGVKAGSAAGIYPSGGGEECCWTGPDVRFQIAVGGTPTALKLDVFEPKLGAFGSGKPQVVSLVDARGAVVASQRVPPGRPLNLAFPLAASDVRDGMANVHLRMQTSYVPKDTGLGPDLRRLALIIKSVSAQ